jgi:hypothetical protein
MNFSSFIEYLIIGALYLIPMFVGYYSIICFKQNQKMRFWYSINIVWRSLPSFIKDNISFDVKQAKLPTLSFVFVLFLIGIIANGTLVKIDDPIYSGLQPVREFLHINASKKENYENKIKIIYNCKKDECLRMLNRIEYQLILARHGIAHSVINIFFLIVILININLTKSARTIWTFGILGCAFAALIGFLVTKAWYIGVSEAILKIIQECP